MATSLDHSRKVSIYNPPKICQDGRVNVLHDRLKYKKYKVMYTKKAIKKDLDTVPFHYSRCIRTIPVNYSVAEVSLRSLQVF